MAIRISVGDLVFIRNATQGMKVESIANDEAMCSWTPKKGRRKNQIFLLSDLVQCEPMVMVNPPFPCDRTYL